jgi:glucose/arabinose dehydrogenase
MRRDSVRFSAVISLLTLALLLAGNPLAAQDATPMAGAEHEDHQSPALGPVATPGGALPGNPQVQLVKVADGLADPINVAAPADDSGRIFVVERPGRIRIVDRDGKLLPEPFLDITDRVNSLTLEQGLLGLAFDPAFKDNGHFYVLFTDLLRNGDEFLMRFTVSDDDPNQADPDSAEAILFIPHPYANHDGGELAFGPDGYLYIGMGDGGLEGDPLQAGQDLSTLLGKLLRIDVHPQDLAAPYAIPPDNPFPGPERQPVTNLFEVSEEQVAALRPEARREIWAYGLRNPWQFSFDPQTGDLFIADAGQNVYEEIDVEPAGGKGGVNYGWSAMEAAHCFPTSHSCGLVGSLPVAEYSHEQDGCVIVGIGVSRDAANPVLDGAYVAADFCSGKVWGLEREAAGSWQFQELLHTKLHPTGGGPDAAGALFLTACGECNYGPGYDPLRHPDGSLWRIVAADHVPVGQEAAPTFAPAEATPSHEEEHMELQGTPMATPQT